MARKTVSIKRKQEESAAAAEKEKTEKKPPSTRKPTTRKAKAKDAEVRMKVFWGVFNQSMKRVALYEFNQKKQAEKKAADLSATGKSPHFVQKVKEAVVPE